MIDLTPTELERYRRQIMLPGFGEEAQHRLKSVTAVVTGVGGLGGTAALYLAVAGVGRLILVRGGELRLDDMNRQILMTEDWIGKPRVFKAKETLQKSTQMCKLMRFMSMSLLKMWMRCCLKRILRWIVPTISQNAIC